MDITEIEYELVNLIHLAQDVVQWGILRNCNEYSGSTKDEILRHLLSDY
jgi:hypothetical protein